MQNALSLIEIHNTQSRVGKIRAFFLDSPSLEYILTIPPCSTYGREES